MHSAEEVSVGPRFRGFADVYSPAHHSCDIIVLWLVEARFTSLMALAVASADMGLAVRRDVEMSFIAGVGAGSWDRQPLFQKKKK